MKRVVRFAAFQVLGRILYYTGALFLIARLYRWMGPRRLLVPMYHRLRPAGEPDADHLLEIRRGVLGERVAEHLRVYAWFGPLLTLSEAARHLREGAGARTCVAVTFDDGYLGCATEALPALQRRGATATVFPVVRTASGGRPLWWDELVHLVRDLQAVDGRAIAAPPLPDGAPAPVCGGASPAQIAECLSAALLELPHGRREAWLDAFAAAHPHAETRRARLYADWTELAQLAGAGVEIGSHTLDHVVLPCEEPAEASRQIRQSREVLEERLGTPVASFAYPNGRESDHVRDAVQEAGYTAAVTVERGVNYRASDPYRLRRIPVGEERAFELAFKLAFYGWAA